MTPNITGRGRAKCRHAKHLGDIVRLFLTQGQVKEFYAILESHSVKDEVDSAMAIFANGAEMDIGTFFRGFLVKAFSERLKAFVLVPIHTVQRNSETGDLEVELRLQERNGACVSCTVSAKDLWPTHPEHQEKANRQPSNLFCDGDLYYVVAVTELRGDQYLFPLIPRVTQIRKNLLKRLSELVELRRKDERRGQFLQRAAEVNDQIEETKRELELIKVDGRFQVPNDAQKDSIWASIEKLEARRKGILELADKVGADDQEMENVLGRVEGLLDSLHEALQKAEQEVREVAESLHSAAAELGVSWAPSSAPQDPRRLAGGAGGGIGNPGVATESAAAAAAAAAARGSTAGSGLRSPRAWPGPPVFGYDSPPAAKRPRLQSSPGGLAPEDGISPKPTKLQIYYMHEHAELLRLLFAHGAMQSNGREDWGKLPEAVSAEARELSRRCQVLEGRLREVGQPVPSQVQVAELYAALLEQERRRLERPMEHEHAQGFGAEQAGRQQLADDHGRPLRLHRQHSTASRQATSGQQGSSQQIQDAAMPKPRAPGEKWHGRVALGVEGKIEKNLESARIWAVPLRGSDNGASTFSDLKNTWIPLVFPVVEPVPDLKDLIPEVGVLAFNAPGELASMVEYGQDHGWYTEPASGAPTCVKSSVCFRDGYLAGQDVVVYLFTHTNKWAREALVDSLSEPHKELFLANKAFLVLVRLGPKKRAEADRSGATSVPQGRSCAGGQDRATAASIGGSARATPAETPAAAAAAAAQPAGAAAPAATSAEARAAGDETGRNAPPTAAPAATGPAAMGPAAKAAEKRTDVLARVCEVAALPADAAPVQSQVAVELSHAVATNTEAGEPAGLGPNLTVARGAASGPAPGAGPAQPDRGSQPDSAAAKPGVVGAPADCTDGQSAAGAAPPAGMQQPQQPQEAQQAQQPQQTQQPQQPLQPQLQPEYGTNYTTAYQWDASQAAYTSQGQYATPYSSYAHSYHTQYNPAAAYSAAPQGYYPAASYQAPYPNYSYGWSWNGWTGYGAAPYNHWQAHAPAAAPQACTSASAAAAEQPAAQRAAQAQAAGQTDPAASVAREVALAQAPWRALDSRPASVASEMSMSVEKMEEEEEEQGHPDQEAVSKHERHDLIAALKPAGPQSVGTSAQEVQAPCAPSTRQPPSQSGQPTPSTTAAPEVEPPLHVKNPEPARRASPEPQHLQQPCTANEQTERQPSPPFSLSSETERQPSPHGSVGGETERQPSPPFSFSTDPDDDWQGA